MAKQPANGRKTQPKRKSPPKRTAVTPESTSKPEVAKVDVIPPEVRPAKAPVAAAPLQLNHPQPPEQQAPAPTPPKTPAPPADPPAAAERSPVLPMILGGVIAGGIGFVIASLATPPVDNRLADRVATQTAKITALEQRINAVPGVDLSGVEATQANILTRVSALEDQVNDAVAALEDKIARLQRMPASDDGTGGLAVAGYQAELDALRTQIEAMTGTAMAQLQEARAEAAAIEENAAQAARNAAARAALARIQVGLESGGPLGAALGDLEAALRGPAPAALLAVQDGAPTLSFLQDEFPAAARAALAIARSEGVSGEETTGIGAFLRNQFDVRSVAPREGDDADAILSRAQGALRAGRLSDTLAELTALPEVARVDLSDWLAEAQARADAMAAVDILSTTLNAN